MAQAGQYTDQGTQGLKEKATERFESMADRASEQLRNVSDRASDAAGRVAEQGREVAGNFKGAVDKSVREQPMATLALAAIAGFVLGALWRR